MISYVGQELREKLENPLIFQAPSTGGNSPPPSKVNGYDVTILIDLCKAVVAADADGKPMNPAVVKQAHIIRYTYERKIVHRFGGQQELELVVPAPKAEPEAANSLGPLFERAKLDEAAN